MKRGVVRRAAGHAAALALGLLLALLAGEIAVRAWRGRLLDGRSPRHDMLRLLRSAYPAQHDQRLGYVPRPGAQGRDNAWGTRVTVDADGLRSNGASTARFEGRPLLAVGDSFTFGDEVDDADTWPARLERRLGRRVLNGGVFGYGLDQAVLRAEELITAHAPSQVVLAFIRDDVERCEYSYRYAAKPWFDVQDGRLVLHGVPVPPPPERLDAPRLVERSHLADFVLLRLARERWLAGGRDVTAVHQRGLEVAGLLVERLAAVADARGARLLLVALGDPAAAPQPSAALLDHARARGVPTLDLLSALREEVRRQPARRAALFAPGGHLAPAGNEWVAEQVARELR